MVGTELADNKCIHLGLAMYPGSAMKWKRWEIAVTAWHEAQRQRVLPPG